MKRLKGFTYLIFFAFLLCCTKTYAQDFSQSPPSLVGEAAILMDVQTGKILYEKNSHTRMEPASTTKIMTAILALEKGNLSDIVTATGNPRLAEGTRIYLEEGEQLTLEEMLYAMLLNSANDAAIAIAEHIAGDVPSFVEMMNQKAREIGAKNTTFVNPNGLTEEGHLTTAEDLALIARYALNNIPKFREIISTKQKTIPWPGKEWDRLLVNTNKLLDKYEYADGVKTGYTTSAGHTLVSSATRDGWQLLAVVLKSDSNNIWKDSIALLEYGFAYFQPIKIIEKEQEVGSIEVKYGDMVSTETQEEFYTVVEKDGPPVTTKPIYKPDIKAPVEKGEVLGDLEIYIGAEKIGSVPILAKNEVKRKIYTLWWFWPVTILLVFYLPFRIMVSIRRYKRRKYRYGYISYYGGKKYYR